MATPISTTNSGSIAFRTNTIYTGLFKSFDPTNDIISSLKNLITENCWSPDITGVLTSAYTSSIQSASHGQYYLDIYQTNPTNSNAEVQYSVAYGHILGSGSAPLATGVASPSQMTYYQYRNLLLPSSLEKFTLANSRALDAITIINLKRDRIKEQLKPGGWELHLSGSNGYLSLIDDYSINPVGTATEGAISYNIVSGSVANGVKSPTKYYGIVYPESGILIMDAAAISASCSYYTDSVATNTNNNLNTFSVIKSGSYFMAQNLQQVHSTYYFVRVMHNMFNYSNNPSFTTGSLGDLRYPTMIQHPNTFITTVGLYNDNNELLAVAKISKPLRKAFDNEQLLRIRLDY